MVDVDILRTRLKVRFAGIIQQCIVAHDEVTAVVEKEHLREFCVALRDEPGFEFQALVDVCGVDYSQYGYSQWQTQDSTASGFSRGVNRELNTDECDKPRFAVVYHLLSVTNNQRLRIRIFVEESDMRVDTVNDIWPSANWYEREAFDLFGLIFVGHPDLRRILTDYGFIGHPFRKDFPLSGHVEVRYDAKRQRVVYEPVDIEPRVLTPRVIREDTRYTNADGEKTDA